MQSKKVLKNHGVVTEIKQKKIFLGNGMSRQVGILGLASERNPIYRGTGLSPIN